jgi:hypothetical protein
MTDRPLTLHERALIATAVAFCAVPSSGFYQQDDRLLRRLADITDLMSGQPFDDQLKVQSGPLQDVFGEAAKLVAAHRNKALGGNAVRNHMRYLACAVFAYFDLRSVVALRALSLPDHVPAAEQSVKVA